MSTSRAKQISQKRKTRTKRSGNGTTKSEFKKKKLLKGPRHLWYSQGSSKRRRR